LAENNRAMNSHQAGPVLLQQKREVAETYQAWGTPAAVLVRADGTIGSPVAQGADAIRTLVAQSVRQTPLKIGDLAPLLELRDLSGKIIGLRDVLGGRVLVLFWNPRCGFCQQMLNDLREWEAGPPPEAPMLVVVSTGTIEENRAMGLRSQVLIDDDFKAATAFGATGTPAGVLIDVTGRIASKVTAGAQAVLALANALPLQMTEPSLSLVRATTSEVRATMSG
jgi:peroxiredoxin